MSEPTPLPAAPATTALTVPLGFGAQIKALQETQRLQALRISALERENAALKASQPQPSQPIPALLARIEALEQHNAHLTQRRKEAVAQLLNLRTLHQEAANAFLIRAADIEEDDLEGMLGAYGTSMTTVLNQHQRALGQMRGRTPMHPYSSVAGVGCCPVSYAYPVRYNHGGYCHAHWLPYPCHVCGQ